MSGETTEKSEFLQSAKNKSSNINSSSSDSGISSGGGSTSRSRQEESQDKRGKSASPSSATENGKSGFFRKKSPGSGQKSGGDPDSDFFDDPFFGDRTRKLFERKRFGGGNNRPRLSERIFGNSRGKGSVFDNDKFVDDLRKRIQEEKKMFFDGSSDPFATAFGAGGGRPASPVGGSAGRTGFPFDDIRSGTRARFDEFANRHPMFSTMRTQPSSWNFDDPFGHHGFPRERNNSGSSGAGSGASAGSTTGEERVIPIQIIREDTAKPQQQRGKSPAPPTRTTPEPSPQPQATGPQRCNTEPTHPIVAEESRAARAQSAPPQNGNPFVSKVSIDTTDSKPQATQMGGNCSKNTKTEPPNPSGGGGRSIPIIIEGRKTPVVNSTSNGSCNSDQSPKANQQPKVSRPAERSPTPPSKKPAPPKDPLAQVTAVLDEVKELEKLVDEYSGNSREDREYLVLDEMLTRCLIKLDVVETEGRDDVRTARKECIRYIQGCISKLEKKAPLPSQPDETGESEQGMETGSGDRDNSKPETENMDIGSQQLGTASAPNDKSPTKEQHSSDTNSKSESQTMEVDGSNNNSSTDNKTSLPTGDQQTPKA